MLIRNFLSPDEVETLRVEIEMLNQLGGFRWEEDHGKTRKFRAKYFKPFHDSLSERVSDVFGKKLTASYDYTRIYHKGATLERHRDRKACQNSMTVNIYNSQDPWPFYVDYGDLEGVSCYLMNPGDAVFYFGPVFPHWRNELTESEECWQQFYHWVDVNGPNMNNANDAMSEHYGRQKAKGRKKEELQKIRDQINSERKDRIISYNGIVAVDIPD